MEVISIFCGKGAVHDFKLLENSKLPIHPDIIKFFDSGYQGVAKIYQNCVIPIKCSKNKPLTKEDKKHNMILSRIRIFIEHVIRRIKIFRITKETYRGKHKNYGKIWNIVAALVNLRYAN